MDNSKLREKLTLLPVNNTAAILDYTSSMISIAFDEVDNIYAYNASTSKNPCLDSSVGCLNAILAALENFVNEAKEEIETSEEQLQKIRLELN